MKRGTLWRVGLGIALAAILAAPAAGDWLVTRDGDRIETNGPWKVDGRKVVFTLASGGLSVMRLSEIDLPASEAATEVASRPPVAAEESSAQPEAPLEPVLVLTNADIAQGAAPADPTEESVSTTAAGEASSSDLRVVRWRREEDPDTGVELRGTVRNMSRNIAADVRISATVRDADGAELGTANAFLDATSMVAGSSTGFRVLFDGIYDFIGEPEWSIQAEMLEVGGKGSPTAQGAANAEAAEDTDDEDGASAPAPSTEAETTAEGGR